jgi:hypothetical protein
MPRYTVHVRINSGVIETIELEKADLSELREEVAVFVGEMLKDFARQVWADGEWRVEVTNGAGQLLYVMRVSTNKFVPP